MIKEASELYAQLIQRFPFVPTTLQDQLLEQLANFVIDNNEQKLFLLKGYAGTGKTTVISTLVNNLWQCTLKSVLMAPTGRAAKVIALYSKKSAFTVHKKIYYPKKNKSGGVHFVLQKNKHTNTIFIVDEASMIPDKIADANLFENSSLLDDLLHYVYSGKNCKLILIGDTAQLPPVKLDLSPALNTHTLTYNYNKDVVEIELNEVMRQHKESGILYNATQLRIILSDDHINDFIFDLHFSDIIRLTDGYEVQDAIHETYDKNGVEATAFIVRSNKRANLYNQQIRSNILGKENEISTGDYIMIVKNNYYWLKDSTEVGFIANGDVCEIVEIFNFKHLYGFYFAEVKLRMVDYPDQIPFETVLLLDTLQSESPSLTFEESNKLYQEIAKDYADERSKYKIMLAVKSNKYFNALQVKFSYAMTCHKSQGGQWENVFIEQPYLSNGQDISYLRWLYTAVTRAQKKLYLIGFKEEYFEE
jgi:ATP-dependent exoDNAse (exonuclease V) alpha subunit